MAKRGLLVLAVLGILASLLGLRQVRAQENGQLSLTSSPLPISLKAKPGSSVSTDIRIKNSGPKTEKLKVGLMKFSAEGEDGNPTLKDREDGDDYFDWVTFSESEFTAEPEEWNTIKMTIDLPDTAAFGYYYAVTFLRADPEEAAGDQQQVIRGGSATLVLLEADVPNAKREMSIKSFTVSKRTYEFLPAKFDVKIHNSGNVHGIPTGTIYIKKGSKQVGTVTVNSAHGNILPNSNRIYSAEWGDGFPAYKLKKEYDEAVSKEGKNVYQLTWNVSEIGKFRFGKYTADIVMVYDDGNRDVPMEATLSFWVIPWRIIFVTLFILIFMGVGIWVTVRKGLFRVRKSHKIEK
jgi:hypothetical protein